MLDVAEHLRCFITINKRENLIFYCNVNTDHVTVECVILVV